MTSGSPVHDLKIDVSAIAAEPGGIAERAHHLLDHLQRVLHTDAAWISLLDPERRTQPALIRSGYDDRVQRFLDSPALMDDVERLGLQRRRRPMRLKDLPVPPDDLPGWAEYLQPAGFREAIAVPLTTTDGRYLGLFAAHTETRTPASDVTCELLAGVAPVIADAVDPVRDLMTMASTVRHAVAGVALTRAGAAHALPGLPAHPMLSPGAPVLRTAATYLAAGDPYAVFLGHDGRGERYLKATALACPNLPPGHLRAIVLLSPAGDLHGLTHRELTILGMLIAGWPHPRIAAHLGLPIDAVIGAMDTVCAKLAAPSEDVAAVRAADRGLHLPPIVAPVRPWGGQFPGAYRNSFRCGRSAHPDTVGS